MVVVIDSHSTDGSDLIASELNFELEHIDPRDFNHGRTRQEAVDRHCMDRDIVVFLTHDAIIDRPESLIELLSAFDDPRTGAAYGSSFRITMPDRLLNTALHTSTPRTITHARSRTWLATESKPLIYPIPTPHIVSRRFTNAADSLVR